MPGGRKLAILEEILERAKRVAEQAEVFHTVQEDTPVSFEANRLKEVDTRESAGVALRIIKDGHVGFSSTTNTSDIQGLVDSAVEMAPFGALARFELPDHRQYPDVPVHDAEVGQISLDEMVQLGQTLIDRVRSHSTEVLCEARVVRSQGTVTVLNSRGGQFSYTKTAFGVGVEGTIVRGEDMLFVMDSASSCRPIRDITPLVQSVAEQLENARVTASIATKSMPVIFTPHGVAGILLAPLLAGLNGKAIVQGTSPLVEKLGAVVMDRHFSLVDDPLVPYAPGSRMCDDEGVPSRQTPLIDEGVVAGFLYDLQTAGQAGTVSTASASRGLGSLPAPGPSVLLVSQGKADYQEMVADLGEGLVVEQLLGAGQSNILSGDFNANVLLGYKVEKGHIVGRVKNTMVSGNVYQVLSNVAAIGREARWIGGSLKTPALYCTHVAVASKT